MYFPPWLHQSLPKGEEMFNTENILKKHDINTVCAEAKCPNRSYCYSNKTATFLALGKACTRACPFCEIDFSKSPTAPCDEPTKIALSSKELGLEHVVITMVARDDLEDGGASQIKKIIERVRELNNPVTIEVLTSDLEGKISSLEKILETRPEIFNHNVETVRRLTPRVRHRATFNRTLSILKAAKESGKSLFIKSGLMVGLGETKEEVLETLSELKEAGCDIITIGQYLQPSKRKLRVMEFVTPEKFEEYKIRALEMGIKHVYSGPFVRSSYNAKTIFKKMIKYESAINKQ